MHANGGTRSSIVEIKKLDEPEFHDFRYYSSKKIRSIRFSTIDFWFPKLKELGTKDEFWTVTQESFFRSYRARGTAVADQRILGWAELERAAGVYPSDPSLSGSRDSFTFSVRLIQLCQGGCVSSMPQCGFIRTMTSLILCSMAIQSEFPIQPCKKLSGSTLWIGSSTA